MTHMTTIKNLANKTGISVSVLRGILGDAGVPVTNANQVITPEDARRIANHVARVALNLVVNHHHGSARQLEKLET